MYNDPEIMAMSEVFEALKRLEIPQVKRILDWVNSKFGLDMDMTMIVQPVPEVSVQPEEQPPMPAPAPEPVAEVEVAQPQEPPAASVETEEAPAVEEKPAPAVKAPSTKGLGLKRYKSIENLFLAANIDTVGSRILLAAAYLQEKSGFTEMSSYDINSRLKKMGYGVSNITTAINGLLNKKPPLMQQLRKEGDTKQAKRKFTVTEEGLKKSKTYLKSASE